MYKDTAVAKRTCHVCGVTILKGDEHYADKLKSHWRWKSARRNVCMLCALQTGVKDEAQKYLDAHPDIRNRMLLKRIQLGVGLK